LIYIDKRLLEETAAALHANSPFGSPWWAIAAAAWRRRTVLPKQGMYVAVDRADVAFRATCYLANSHRALTDH